MSFISHSSSGIPNATHKKQTKKALPIMQMFKKHAPNKTQLNVKIQNENQ